MRPAWRLAINSLSGRRSRSALLIGAVALSAALIVTVACAMWSIQRALNAHVDAAVGQADLRLKPAGTGKTLPITWLQTVQTWPEVAHATGRLEAPLAVTFTPPGDSEPLRATALGHGVDGSDLAVVPDLIAGRHARAHDEIVVDALLADLLSPRDPQARPDVNGWRLGGVERREPAWYAASARARSPAPRVLIGDQIQVVRQILPAVGPAITIPFLQRPVTLSVVGIADQPPLGGRAQAYLTRDGLARLAGAEGRLSQIDIALLPGIDPEAAAASRRAEIGSERGLLLQTTAKVTSGVDQNVRSSQLGFVLATFMAFLSASFIILTGLTTSVVERQRELAILRCIGAERGQLARAQLLVGLIIGTLGAAVGVPLGLLFAWTLATVFGDQLTTGLAIPPEGIVLATLGSMAAGAAGAAWPAWRASTMSPLEALAARAAVPRIRGIQWVTVLGLLGLLGQAIIVGVPQDGQVIFWGYATAGLPLMFAGYFLLGVPTILLVTWLAARPLSRMLALPRGLLSGTIGATPYRYGLTAGALMGGLALMVALWTNGGAFLRDWLDKINFPDAFVSGPALPPWAQERLNGMTDIVERTCAITLHQVETDVFGVRALQRYKSTFIAFEPRPFFAMMQPQWVQGDAGTAISRLEAGGAVIVAREFHIAQGLGVGDTFRCWHDGEEFTFEIVGVVTSPGLEIVSKFFNIGEDFTDQSLHAVFGSRGDLRDRFRSDATQLIQIDLKDGVDDGAALDRIRRELFGAGLLDAGSGRQVKDTIRSFVVGALGVVAAVSVTAMLVACFGVANLIVAAIEARRFEFGVLRAVGAQRGTLARLVLGEAMLVALAACVLGTLMGIQGSWAGQRLDRLLMGIDMRLRPPPLPIAVSWAILVVLTLGAAVPAVLRLNRLRPRDLLGSVRG